MAQSEPVSFRNGKISFATGDAFNEFLTKEFKKPYAAYQQDLRAIVPANAQARMNTEAQDDDVVKDPYFSGLLNADRELALEGTNYRMTSVGTFAFKEEKRALAMEAIRKTEANFLTLRGADKPTRMMCRLNSCPLKVAEWAGIQHPTLKCRYRQTILSLWTRTRRLP